MFATDRDLLVYEPNLFRDFVFLTQRLTLGVADVSESTLSFYPDENSLAAVAITAGHIITIAGIAYEIIQRTDENEAIISRPRTASDAPIIPPPPLGGSPAFIATFAPQMHAVHVRIVRMIGIEPQGVPVPGQPKEGHITNPEALRALECFGTLELIFRAAGTLLDDAHPINQRARFYAAAFESERERATAHLDANADGIPDTARKLNGSTLIRG